MTESADADLATRAAGGDTWAFEALVRRHYTAVWRVAFGSVRDEMAAEELTQDTFLRAFGALARWRGEASLRTWLTTICRRLCIDRARRKQLDVVGAPDLDAAVSGAGAGNVADVTGTPGSAPDAEALADRFDLQAALGQLPAGDREAFLLIHHFGYSSFEAAALLGMPASTVRTRAGRARQQLATALSRQPVMRQDPPWRAAPQQEEPA